jgi:hypothetical protein
MARARLALAALCVVALAAGCAGRSGPGDGPPAAGPATAPPTAPASTSPPASTSRPAARPDWPTTPRSTPWPKIGDAAELVAVRTGRHGGFERVVFEFRGPAPGYLVRYVPEVTLGESDEAVRLPGRAFLQVSFLQARAHRLDDPNVSTLDGPETLTPRYPVMRQLTLANDWEGEVRFGVGLTRKAGFRVLRLADPTRIAVDVAA